MSSLHVDMHSKLSNLLTCRTTQNVLIHFCWMLLTLTFRSRQQWLDLLDLCPSLHCPEQTSQNLLRLHDWLVWIPSSSRRIHPHLMSSPACNKNTWWLTWVGCVTLFLKGNLCFTSSRLQFSVFSPYCCKSSCTLVAARAFVQVGFLFMFVAYLSHLLYCFDCCLRLLAVLLPRWLRRLGKTPLSYTSY